MRALHKSILLLLASLGCVWAGHVSSDEGSSLEVHFLSVGQGDCTVVQYEGVTILIDSGPKTKHFDAGERIVTPKLRALGIQNIDLLILTHPDMDHIGGLSGISRRFSISRVIVPSYFSKNPAILEQIANSGISKDNLVSISDDQQIKISEFVMRFSLPEWDPALPDNEGSLVSQIFVNSKPIALLSGDLGSDAEFEQANQITKGSPILLAGHHGSSGSTSSAWLRIANPKWVVISCGTGNSYGHPAKETLDRITQSKADGLRTDLLGDISFRVKNGRIERVR